MVRQLARVFYRRRRLVVAGWLVLLAGLFALSQAAGGAFSTEFGTIPGTESEEAQAILREKGFADRTGAQAQIVFTSPRGVAGPSVRQAMEPLFAAIARDVPDATVVSPYAPDGARQISADGAVAYAQVNLADRSQEAYAEAADQIEALRAEVQAPETRIDLGGEIFAAEGEPGSEMIGLLAAMVILLVAFGSVLAMGLPIVTALFGIAGGFALVGLATRLLDIPDFTTAAAAMIGIGVGIDYALFIVTRYRQGLHDGLDPEEATVLAMNTAGRAVLFAGITVVISVLGIFLINLEAMRGLAVGMAAAVLMTMLAALTLLPALLGFAGRNIDRLGLPHRRRADGPARHSLWHRWSRVIQRYPWPAALGGFALLVVLALPVFAMRLGFPDAGNLPETATSRRAYDLLAQGFGPGFNGPLIVAIETDRSAAATANLNGLAVRLRETPGVAHVTPPFTNAAGDGAILQIAPTTSPQDEATTDLVHRLRGDVIPAATAGSGLTVKLTGGTAAAVDFADYTTDRMPPFFGAVLLLSFVLLMWVFRSLLVPLKAVVMNLLSIGAAYGVIVAVFQWGWGADLIGVGKEGPIETWVPMMLFAIVFGLSMDYEVFLLSRVREEYDRTGDNALAVADGLAATARVITAAAAIMVVVFSTFVLGEDRAIKLLGLGLAVAVFVDATVVRLLLVPATMELLGDRNWWLPRWLDRLLPAVSIEAEQAPARRTPARAR